MILNLALVAVIVGGYVAAFRLLARAERSARSIASIQQLAGASKPKPQQPTPELESPKPQANRHAEGRIITDLRSQEEVFDKQFASEFTGWTSIHYIGRPKQSSASFDQRTARRGGAGVITPPINELRKRAN